MTTGVEGRSSECGGGAASSSSSSDGDDDTPAAVVMALTAAGSVESYTSVVQLSLRQTMADEAGTDVAAVSLSVESASVILSFSILTSGTAAAQTVADSLAAAFPDAATATTVLGVSIEVVEGIQVTDAPGIEGGDDDDSSGVDAGVIAGATVGAVVFLCLVVLAALRLANKKAPSLEKPSVAALEKGEAVAA